MTGKVKNKNFETYKLAIDDGTRLSEEQKTAAFASVKKCLSDEFPWPQSLMQYQEMEKYFSEGTNILNFYIFKSFFFNCRSSTTWSQPAAAARTAV